jgi:G3E family GTPase
MASIPMQLVTGFLGSGKTTFLKHYLEKLSGSGRIGIIQNEFSEVNVDSQDLRQSNSGFEILEVNNGSVFCVCLLGSFVGSLAAFIDQVHPDELIMEASGMSDPLSIGQILQAPSLKQKVYLDRVWCLVDALNFSRISALQTRVNHQVRMADVVLVNKTDLLEGNNDELVERVKKINPFAEIVQTTFAKVEFNNRKPIMKFLHPGEKAENGRPDLESQVIKSSRSISPEKLNEFINLTVEGCIRCKGYVNLNNGEKVFVQGSYDRYSLQNVESFSGPTELVIIGNFPEKTSFQKLFDSFCIL